MLYIKVFFIIVYMDKILILDFGSQTTALIGRRIREAGVFAEIIAGDSQITPNLLQDVCGIIFSGSPESVYDKGALPCKQIYEYKFPLLGICYGMQRMMFDLGGAVEPLPIAEYGAVEVKLDIPYNIAALNKKAAAFLEPLNGKTFTSWMSHGDTVTRIADGFVEIAHSATSPAIVIHESKPFFAVQFHPEVTHCEYGIEVINAFVFGVCGCKKSWTMEQYLQDAAEKIKARVKNDQVLLLISGGVDSTVAGAMLLKILDPDNVHLMYMDTGLMRKNETELVSAALKKLGARHLHIIHCEDEFLTALKGLSEPEKKRKIIGDLFIQIQEREVARLGMPQAYFLAQGTLYTDLIESGKGVGAKAHIIKSHHNVGSPLVEAKRKDGRIIEPLDLLYKDEVRALGRLLNLDETIVGRHPFPGPGLAVRILGEVTAEKCRILRAADAVFIEELKKRTVRSAGGCLAANKKSLYDDIWQAFAVLLPVNSVGVAGDVRKYGQVLALRAVTSQDGMTADVYPFDTKDLLEISALITNKVPEIGRVCYDISSKPPSTIEWE
ncbi:MAG: glutamine-hydrolyzing GMP synthase [Termitinemataceae bacterium]|nr:MAG: glutamine-hydrolyzing GMP synthase [Termitinemataceae bacterium]